MVKQNERHRTYKRTRVSWSDNLDISWRPLWSIDSPLFVLTKKNIKPSLCQTQLLCTQYTSCFLRWLVITVIVVTIAIFVSIITTLFRFYIQKYFVQTWRHIFHWFSNINSKCLQVREYCHSIQQFERYLILSYTSPTDVINGIWHGDNNIVH